MVRTDAGQASASRPRPVIPPAVDNTLVWINGRRDAALPLPERAVEFGDSLFETLLVLNGTPLFPALHFERLEQGLKRLRFPRCVAAARGYVEEALRELAAARDWPECALRLTVTRGPAQRGYKPPRDQRPGFIIYAAPLGRDPRRILPPARIAVARTRLGENPQLAGIKHGNRLEQVLAAAEQAEQGVDEMLMLDQSGSVVSVISGNVFAVINDTLSTPALDGCGVAGTRRRLILEKLAPGLGLRHRVEPLALEDLLEAQEIFYCNSLTGIRPVANMPGREWDDHPVAAALHNALWQQGQQ